MRSQPYTLYGNNLIGDTLMQTPAIRALKQAQPAATIQYWIGTSRGGEKILRGNPYLSGLDEVDFPPDTSPQIFGMVGNVVNMQPMPAFQWGASRGRSLAAGYGSMLGVEVIDPAYDYFMTEEEAALGQQVVTGWIDLHGKTPVICARHSASCSSNDPKVRTPNKCLPNRHWVLLANWLLSKGFLPVAVGAESEVGDARYHEWPGITMYGRPIREVAAILRAAAGTIAVDTGIRHLAAAVGGHMACLSGCIPLSLIKCHPVREDQKTREAFRPLIHCQPGHLIALAEDLLL